MLSIINHYVVTKWVKKLSTFVHDVYESYQENYKLWLVRARNYKKYKLHYDKVTVLCLLIKVTFSWGQRRCHYLGDCHLYGWLPGIGTGPGWTRAELAQHQIPGSGPGSGLRFSKFRAPGSQPARGFSSIQNYLTQYLFISVNHCQRRRPQWEF